MAVVICVSTTFCVAYGVFALLQLVAMASKYALVNHFTAESAGSAHDLNMNRRETTDSVAFSDQTTVSSALSYHTTPIAVVIRAVTGVPHCCLSHSTLTRFMAPWGTEDSH